MSNNLIAEKRFLMIFLFPMEIWFGLQQQEMEYRGKNLGNLSDYIYPQAKNIINRIKIDNVRDEKIINQ